MIDTANMSGMPATPDAYRLSIGPRLSISFQRTLRIPEDGRPYPLPPGLGAFPIYRARLFPAAPADWRNGDDLFISLYEREALWIGMQGASWHPEVVSVGLGNVNAVSGRPWQAALSDSPQNYLVCPPQPWLDGVNAGSGVIRQFVAMPVGSEFTVEHQVKAKEEAGGLRIAVFEAKPGIFPDGEPPREANDKKAMRAASPMGLAPGGLMTQKIYPDPHGLATWNPDPIASLRVHILNSAYFQTVTGNPPPPTPVDAKAYTDAGLPWFELYDKDHESLPIPNALKGIRSTGSLGERETPVEVPEKQIWRLG